MNILSENTLQTLPINYRQPKTPHKRKISSLYDLPPLFLNSPGSVITNSPQRKKTKVSIFQSSPQRRPFRDFSNYPILSPGEIKASDIFSPKTTFNLPSTFTKLDKISEKFTAILKNHGFTIDLGKVDAIQQFASHAFNNFDKEKNSNGFVNQTAFPNMHLFCDQKERAVKFYFFDNSPTTAEGFSKAFKTALQIKVYLNNRPPVDMLVAKLEGKKFTSIPTGEYKKETKTEEKRAKNNTRLIKEALTLKDIDHPNVCPLYDWAKIVNENNEESVVLYTELFENDLSTFLKSKENRATLTPHLQDLFIEYLEGLLAMHTKGYVHSDIKTSNLLIKRLHTLFSPFRASIGDLGSVNTTECTFKWLSPQRLPSYLKEQGQKATPQDDVWALGIVFHELLYGVKPNFTLLLSCLESVQHDKTNELSGATFNQDAPLDESKSTNNSLMLLNTDLPEPIKKHLFHISQGPLAKLGEPNKKDQLLTELCTKLKHDMLQLNPQALGQVKLVLTRILNNTWNQLQNNKDAEVTPLNHLITQMLKPDLTSRISLAKALELLHPNDL